MSETLKIFVGGVPVGGGAPVSVQTMTNTDTKDAEATANQILLCQKYGLDIVRCAINDEADAKALKAIKKRIHVPVVADIQYDYSLAMWALENGADCIRINPGNMKSKEDLKKLVSALKSENVPIRIGVNSGSIATEVIDRFGGVNAKSLVSSAIAETETLEDLDFRNFKVAIKSSDIKTCVESYREYSRLKNYPLHLGVTEAGPYEEGSIKSAIGIGTLLLEGIGDTIRVSLTDEPYKEVIAGNYILKSLGLNKHGINLISCPTCARTNGDMISMVKDFKAREPKIKGKMSVAIMGCHVNGPGEAREADIGLALNKKGGIIFKKGKILEEVTRQDAITKLIERITEIDNEHN